MRTSRRAAAGALTCGPGNNSEASLFFNVLWLVEDGTGALHIFLCRFAGYGNHRRMRSLLLGIDSGTQSTKVLVVDARNGNVLAEAAQKYGLIPNLPTGAKEQHPETWRDAMAKAICAALKNARASASEVKAIGVSGQQHGFVPMDKNGEVIRPAKLWCDTSTAAECEEITAKLG